MGFEDVDAGAAPAVTDYAIGGRGLDRLAKTVSGTTSVAYPIFDGHGNMVATLAESGSGYSTGNQRSFDAWGNILGGSGSGDPKGRYCASLGHKQDDESGLVYMRARFYDPVSGRFICEDSSGDGRNWFSYCVNDPVNKTDYDGKGPTGIWNMLFLALENIEKLLHMAGGDQWEHFEQGAAFLCAINAANESFEAAGLLADMSGTTFGAGSLTLLSGGASGLLDMAAGVAMGVASMAMMVGGIVELYSAACSLEIIMDSND
jgi:RHS repeat-associated protein